MEVLTGGERRREHGARKGDLFRSARGCVHKRENLRLVRPAQTAEEEREKQESTKTKADRPQKNPGGGKTREHRYRGPVKQRFSGAERERERQHGPGGHSGPAYKAGQPEPAPEAGKGVLKGGLD